jgi:hypothetical protein
MQRTQKPFPVTRLVDVVRYLAVAVKSFVMKLRLGEKLVRRHRDTLVPSLMLVVYWLARNRELHTAKAQNEDKKIPIIARADYEVLYFIDVANNGSSFCEGPRLPRRRFDVMVSRRIRVPWRAIMMYGSDGKGLPKVARAVCSQHFFSDPKSMDPDDRATDPQTHHNRETPAADRNPRFHREHQEHYWDEHNAAPENKIPGDR